MSGQCHKLINIFNKYLGDARIVRHKEGNMSVSLSLLHLVRLIQCYRTESFHLCNSFHILLHFCRSE
jgi:hypothetical protein